MLHSPCTAKRRQAQLFEIRCLEEMQEKEMEQSFFLLMTMT
jgi:hypothetical protein